MDGEVEIIDVRCIVFPTGETLFTDDTGKPEQYIEEWKLRNAKREQELKHTLGGFILLRMLRKDYEALPAALRRDTEKGDGDGA